MAATQTLFLSCVSEEFKQHRLRLANQLGALPGAPYRIVVQEDFRQGGGSLLEWLDEQIVGCDLVIHLAGELGGQVVTSAEHIGRLYARWGEAVPTPLPTYTYTQWEYWLARRYGKPTLVYSLALPKDHVFPDAVQAAHWAAVRASGEHRKSFADAFELVREVYHDLGLRPDHKTRNLRYASLQDHFWGRAAFLSDLDQRLNALSLHFRGHQLNPAIGGAKPTALPALTVVVHGLAGVGKTRAVVEYAHRRAEHFVALLFVGADSPTQLDAQLAALCGPAILNLPAQHEKEQEKRVAAATRWLQEHPGWLLILDNVDTTEAQTAVRELLGKLQGSGLTLITSRLRTWSRTYERLELREFTTADATSYLLTYTEQDRRCADDDAAAAAQVAEDLGGLALALEQAGAYIRQQDRPPITLAEYRAIWQTNYERVWAWSPEMENLLDGYPKSVAVTWQTSFEQLSPAAQVLLQRLAWLSPEPVPQSLLATPVPEAEPLDAEAAEKELEAFSLAQPTDNGEGFSVHRLVQAVTRNSQQEDVEKPRLREALGWVDAGFVGSPQRDVHTWPVLKKLAPHAKTVTFDFIQQVNNPDPTARLLNQVSLLYLSQAAFTEAEPLMRRALQIDENSFGANHPRVASIFNNLAQLLKDTNRLAEAEPLMLRALQIDEDSFGANHPDVATNLNNLAQLLKDTNRMVEAEPLMRRALQIDEARFGANHPGVATDLNNLAGLLSATNRLTEAEPLYRRALQINEASLGANHPGVATDLNNLAGLLSATNRLTEAEPLYRRALQINEASFGANHPEVATNINSLAQLLKDTNRQAEAELLMRRALLIDQDSYGPNHPAVAISLNNLAQLLKVTNRLTEAELLYRRALQIDEASFGADHPNVARDLNNLAQLLQATDRLADAEPLMRRALQIDEDSFGPNHPSVARDLNNLAQLFKVTDRLADAEPLMRRALQIDEDSFGSNHPTVAIHLNNLIKLLKATNRPAEAELLMRRALQIDEASFGADHPEVALRLNNLAQLLYATNRLAEAEPLLRRAFLIFFHNLGGNHSNTVTVANNYFSLIQEIGLSEKEAYVRIQALLDKKGA